jgi:hypothetical protein
MLTLRTKKSISHRLSFKLHEIKFCTLLINWLIWEKMFTYFYNKFRPMNCMHYIKCGVTSSLLTQFWLLQVCGTLDYCFIMTHSIHKEGDILQIHFCVIFRKTRHHAQAHVTSGTLCALSLAARRTQTAAQLG